MDHREVTDASLKVEGGGWMPLEAPVAVFAVTIGVCARTSGGANVTNTE